MKTALLAFSVLVAITASPSQACKTGEYPPIPIKQYVERPYGTLTWRGPLTPQEIEAEKMGPADSVATVVPPIVPFGAIHHVWLALRQLESPDALYYHFVEPDGAATGYALVCDGNVIGAIITSVS